MKVFVTILVGLLLSTSAQAISLTFKFDIHSSGSDIYACNAGIMHKPYSGRICYERGQPEVACNPNLCEEGKACNCVCTGSIHGNGAGEYRLDYLAAEYTKWTDNGYFSSGVTKTDVEAGTYEFNQLFSNHIAFDRELKNLSFKLGSERYGATYFVDICFRASQVKYGKKSSIHWNIDRQVTITDLLKSSGKNYEKLSGLQVKTKVACWTKDHGDVTYEDGSWKTFNGNHLIGWPTQGVSRDLKKCKVRYFFQESTAAIRPWTKQEAQVCTYTSFNEPKANSKH